MHEGAYAESRKSASDAVSQEVTFDLAAGEREAVEAFEKHGTSESN